MNDQTEATDKLTELVETLQKRLTVIEEEVQLADISALSVPPLAKFIYPHMIPSGTHVLGYDDGQEVEFDTTPLSLAHDPGTIHESIVFRLTSGEKFCAIEIDFPADPENSFLQSFKIDDAAMFIPIVLTILNGISDGPVFIPRGISKTRAPPLALKGPTGRTAARDARRLSRAIRDNPSDTQESLAEQYSTSLDQ